MKKFLGFLLKILLLAILIVFLYGARNIYIYNELNGEVSKYVKKNIVHTTTTIEAGGEYQIFDVYQRGENQVVVTKIITVNNEDGIDVSTFYHDRKGENDATVYIATKDGKTKMTNSAIIVPVEKPSIHEYNYKYNISTFFHYALARISKVECNGEDAYQIRFFGDKDNFLIVSKATGLILQEKNGTQTKGNKTADIFKRYEYEFDTVEQDMVDIEKYIDTSEYTDATNAKPVVTDTKEEDENPEEDATNTTNTVSNTITNDTNTVNNTENNTTEQNTAVTNTTAPNNADQSTAPTKEKYGESSFVATVGKKYSTTMIVEGTEENDKSYYQNEFSITISDDVKIFKGNFSTTYQDIKVGDKVRIYYDDGILETHPARIPGTTAIEVLSK